jgi:hypothetical protein
MDQIAASMVEFGWTNSILVDENAGILAGHGRLLAARKLGLAEVPVIRFEHLSEAQKRTYLIADNQLALQAGWSEELLAEELAWLRDERFDLNLIGFDATELERLLALADGEAATDEAEDEVPDHYWCGTRDQGDVWFFDKPVRNDLHPTMKPVALVERAIRNSSKSRDTVLDPFGGSGSTLIACEKTGRQTRLVELDPKYCDVIIMRSQEFSGGIAILDEDGRSYEEITAQRSDAS